MKKFFTKALNIFMIFCTCFVLFSHVFPLFMITAYTIPEEYATTFVGMPPEDFVASQNFSLIGRLFGYCTHAKVKPNGDLIIYMNANQIKYQTQLDKQIIQLATWNGVEISSDYKKITVKYESNKASLMPLSFAVTSIPSIWSAQFFSGSSADELMIDLFVVNTSTGEELYHLTIPGNSTHVSFDNEKIIVANDLEEDT